MSDNNFIIWCAQNQITLPLGNYDVTLPLDLTKKSIETKPEYLKRVDRDRFRLVIKSD